MNKLLKTEWNTHTFWVKLFRLVSATVKYFFYVTALNWHVAAIKLEPMFPAQILYMYPVMLIVLYEGWLNTFRKYLSWKSSISGWEDAYCIETIHIHYTKKLRILNILNFFV